MDSYSMKTVAYHPKHVSLGDWLPGDWNGSSKDKGVRCAAFGLLALENPYKQPFTPFDMFLRNALSQVNTYCSFFTPSICNSLNSIIFPAVFS
jgi:hypothetical protein